MPTRLLLACLLACCVSCRRQSTASSPPTEPAVKQGAPASNTEAAGADTTPSTAAANEAQMAAVLGELTQAVRQYSVEQRRVPKSLDELVTGGYLARLPQAPTGKKFAIDKNLQVSLAKQ